MNLYHYSAEQYPVLKTRRKLGLQPPKQVRDSSYLDHISFFFDPIPSKTLSLIFGKNHPFWFEGNVIYEHVVDVSDLDKDVRFHVVESKQRTELLDQFAEENNWVKDDPALLAKWLILERRKNIEWGEIGYSRAGLEKQIKQHVGGTELAYIAASSRDDFEHGRNKYAASVPHLMIYPRSGEIPVRKVFKLKIGDDHRKELTLD